MADKTIRLNAPGGGTVVVAADKQDGLLRRGFTSEQAKTTSKTTAKKTASSSKSSKS